MSTSPPAVIRRPQDVVDLVNAHPARRGGPGIALVALGGVMIDAYQAAMVGFGNSYIADEYDISKGAAAAVNATVLVAALVGGLIARPLIERLGQRRAFVLGMGLCAFAAAAVAFAPNIWIVLLCRVVMGVGLGIDFPLATSAVVELSGSRSSSSGRSVNLWQMGWYISTTVVYLVLLPLNQLTTVESDLWRYGIFVGAGLAVLVMVGRWFLIGESALWAARRQRWDETVRILRDRYGVHATVAPDAEGAAPGGQAPKVRGAYRVMFDRTYRRRTVLGCVVATMQAWQYNAVGIYLPVTLGGVLSGGLAGSLGGSALVNAAFGITGGLLGSLWVRRFGARRLSMAGFAVVAVCLLVLGALGSGAPWLALFLLGLIIFGHAAGPGGLGMTIATLSYPPSIRPAGVGFARAIMRTGAIAGLVLWPMLWDGLGTEAFFWLALVPGIGLLTCLLIRWEPVGQPVDDEDADVLRRITAVERVTV
ncbi:MFS transporter [Streptomyces sp. 3MP-14]|uniref:MFS transporter n=1 Tax=Streptomyces mimosae TaxID=2586635 RepID=A0A5N6A6G9_9ACTN|nr:MULTISPECIES: MFS transporter [Streptomyces]KAB8163832.1 MFS transporter [Streptomyces mimosae]KAB8175275.1 MFS transporter [Streptomyces sp. 3MP-14]